MWIDKEDFDKIIIKYPLDNEKYIFLRDQKLLQCDDERISYVCNVCGSFTH